MSHFSSYLESYFNKNGITVANLASKLNIDRSILYRYVKGKRVPENEKIVRNIAYNLCMTMQETDKLIELYDRLVCGDEKVDNYLYFKNFLEGLKERENEATGKTNLWRASVTCDDNMRCMWTNSMEELLLMIGYLFDNIVNSESIKDKKVYIITQSTSNALQRSLRYYFDNTDVVTEHIICLEKREELRYRNLDVLLDIITTSFADMKYSNYYYYRNISDMSEFDWLPNVIIAGDSIIQFDNNMQNGTYIRDREYAKGAYVKYNSIRKYAVSLSNGMLFDDYTNNLMDENYNFDKKICANLMWEPGLIYAIGSDILKTNLVDMPQKDDYIKYRENIGGVWDNLNFKPSEFLLRKKDSVIRFQYSGLIRFMETGCSCEFPHKAYIPLDMSQRITTLKRLIELSRMKIFLLELIDDRVELPEKVFVYRLVKTGGLRFGMVNDLGTLYFNVSEAGFQYSFDMFIEELERKGFTKGNDDTRAIMEEVCREYERRL